VTCKIHLATDGKGRPLGLVLTGGNAADTSSFTTVLDTISLRDGRPGRPRTRPEQVLADKAYTSAANRRYLTARGSRSPSPSALTRRQDAPAAAPRADVVGGVPEDLDDVWRDGPARKIDHLDLVDVPDCIEVRRK
jgi:hypothetical protein